MGLKKALLAGVAGLAMTASAQAQYSNDGITIGTMDCCSCWLRCHYLLKGVTTKLLHEYMGMHFGREVMKAYDAFFLHKLDRFLLNGSRDPMDRLVDFIADAKKGLAKYRYTRGCLVGNLSQELGALPSTYRKQLDGILTGWQQRVAQCLRLAQKQGAIERKADCDALAEYFWIGWEGAVMRARLVQNADPLDTFVNGFLKGLPR